MKLDELRVRIDEIDQSIIELLEKRLEIAVKIGEYKKGNNLPIEDSDREYEKLKKISDISSPEFSLYNQMVFMNIISVSKKIQSKIVLDHEGLDDNTEDKE